MAEIRGAAAATTAAIPGVLPEASARLLALLSAEPAVEEVWLYGSKAMGRHHRLRHRPHPGGTSCPNPWLSTWPGWGGCCCLAERRRHDAFCQMPIRLGEGLTSQFPRYS